MNELLKVKILAHTPNPEEVIAQSAKLCYSKVGVDEIMEKLTPEKIEEFINMLISIGHESPLEHVSYTFAIEGIDRATSHQLVRHRIASFSQQSQRYVNLNDTFSYITPEILKAMGKDEVQLWDEDMKYIHSQYMWWQNKIENWLDENPQYPKHGMSAEKVANENARGILPNACETKMVFTMNVRELLHFFNKRCCKRAQETINGLAWEMLYQVRATAPILFTKAGAPCCNGKCKEGKMSCGSPYNE